MEKKLVGYGIIAFLILYLGFAVTLSTLIIKETSCENPNVSCDIEFHVEKMKQVLGRKYTNNWGGYFETYPDLMHRLTVMPTRIFNLPLKQSFTLMRGAYLAIIIALAGMVINRFNGKTIHKVITALILLQTGVIGLTLGGLLARTGVVILLLAILATKKQSSRNVLLLIMALTHHYGILIAIITYIITSFTKNSDYEPHMISVLIILGYFVGMITKAYFLIQARMLATTMLGLLLGLIVIKLTENDSFFETS